MHCNSKKVLQDDSINTATARDAYYPYPDSMGRILRIEFVDNFGKQWVGHLIMLLFVVGVIYLQPIGDGVHSVSTEPALQPVRQPI